MPERTVAHLDLDTFFVSVERLMNSRLNQLPVIVGGGSDRGVVSACSYEARKYAVHSGMPMKMARQLCPDAVVIRGDMDTYTRYSRMVTDIIAEAAPVYEKASIDEHYLDLTGLDRFFGMQKWSHELRTRIIKETGLPVSLGMSVNKTVAKIATGESKPCGEIYVQPAMIAGFLDPLSIRKIPMLGKQSYRLLRSMGVPDIRTLKMIPPGMMEKVLGKNGRSIWDKANGIDPTPVIQYSERKSIGSEHTFERDTTDVECIRSLLSGSVEKLCFKLRKDQWLVSCITVKIRYSDFNTFTLQKRIAYTSFDHTIMKTTLELFEKLYNRRMLIRLVGVRFSGLIRGTQQLNLFEDTPEMVNLYIAMDNIRKRFGTSALKRAGGMWQRGV